MRSEPIILFAALVLTVGCTSPPDPPLPHPPSTPLPGKIYAGLYVLAEHESSLTPCNTTDRWDVKGFAPELDEFLQAHPEVRGGHGVAQVFVRLRGELSDQGHYGHIGVYSRQLTITEVIEVRAPTINDCQVQSGV